MNCAVINHGSRRTTKGKQPIAGKRAGKDNHGKEANSFPTVSTSPLLVQGPEEVNGSLTGPITGHRLLVLAGPVSKGCWGGRWGAGSGTEWQKSGSPVVSSPELPSRMWGCWKHGLQDQFQDQFPPGMDWDRVRDAPWKQSSTQFLCCRTCRNLWYTETCISQGDIILPKTVFEIMSYKPSLFNYTHRNCFSKHLIWANYSKRKNL